MNDRLSRKIGEFKGNRQGHVRASGHFKVYINPGLLSLNSSNLGFNLGLLNTTAVCVADDTYLHSDTPSGLQGALDIMSHYAKSHQLKFNAGKTKIVVTGSKVDMSFYKETTPWTLNGETVRVVDNNEHLGLIVSGIDEERKNIDENIIKCRKSLLALLGPAYAFRCLLSPMVQVHLWRTYNLPVLLSGLSALPVRPSHTKPLIIFHNKILRGFLKLSQSSPIPALHFLLGELPTEAALDIHTLNLFHNVWTNSHTTVFNMVTYIMKMCSTSSTTWSNHIQLLCYKYGLPAPLTLLQNTPWSKSSWSCLVKTRVTLWHENLLKRKALSNSKMCFLNVQLHGLTGQPHKVLHNITTTQEAKKLRLHIKFLVNDFLTNERLSLDQPSISPACPLCHAPLDSIEHVLVVCRATSEVRDRLLPELLNTVAMVQPMCQLLALAPAPQILTQFVLDCSSLNLPDCYRIPTHNPRISEIFKVSRDWTFGIGSERSRLMKQLKTKTTNSSKQ